MDNSKLIQSFLKNGYLILEKAIPRNVINETHLFLNEKIQDYLKYFDVDDDCDFLTISTLIKRDFNKLDETTKHLLSGHFDLTTRLDNKLYKIFNQAEELLILIRKLLNTNNLYLHMPPAARWIMPSNENAAVPAHQDISYNKHLSNFIVCWVPFVDITHECGGVYVYENTGNLGEIESKKNEFWLEGIDTTEYTGEHKIIKQGDVLLLNPFVIHSSFPNTSLDIRISCDYRFFGDNDTSSKSYLDFSTGIIVRQH